jgi:hypothetical protein
MTHYTRPQILAMPREKLNVLCAQIMEPQPEVKPVKYSEGSPLGWWRWWRSDYRWSVVKCAATDANAAGLLRARCGEMGLARQFVAVLREIVGCGEDTRQHEAEWLIANASPDQVARAAAIVLGGRGSAGTP